MTVVVTGAAGFLGRALVADLLGDGIPVIGIDRRPAPGPQAHADRLHPDPAGAHPGPDRLHPDPAGAHPGPDRLHPDPGLTSAAWRELRADLLDPDPAVAAALRTADVVFHLAGRPGVRDAGPAAAAARARDNVAATAA